MELGLYVGFAGMLIGLIGSAAFVTVCIRHH